MDGTTRNQVIRYIDSRRDEIVNFLCDFIRFRSINYQTTGDERQCQEWYAARLREMGLSTDLFDVDIDAISKYPDYVPPQGRNYQGRPNVVGVLKGKGGGRSLLINGHVDVVPATDESKWKYGPWSGSVEEGRVYGRGASDMKGGLTAAAMAIKCLIDLKLRPLGDVIIESVVDEESSGNGTLMCVAKGYRADAGVVVEGTNLAIQPAHRGVQFLKVVVRGQAGHAAYKRRYVNAIQKMCLIIEALQRYEDDVRQKQLHPLLPAPTISVGMIQGGSAPHIVPDSCEINCDVKYLPYEDGAQVREQIERYLSDVCKGDPWLRDHPAETVWWLDAGPSETSVDHPFVSILSSAHQAIKGETPVVSGMAGCCDMRHLIRHGGTPCVVYGPGILECAHAVDEFVPVEDLLTATKVLALTILEWCGVSKG